MNQPTPRKTYPLPLTAYVICYTMNGIACTIVLHAYSAEDALFRYATKIAQPGYFYVAIMPFPTTA